MRLECDKVVLTSCSLVHDQTSAEELTELMKTLSLAALYLTSTDQTDVPSTHSATQMGRPESLDEKEMHYENANINRSVLLR